MSWYSDCMVSDIALGTRVQINHQGKKYRPFNLVGKIGIIRSNYGSNLAIEFDDIKNPASGPGYFYLGTSQFTIVDEDENDIMEENNMATNVNNITNYLRAIKVKFIGESSPCGYPYACFNAVEVGDLVVVKPAHHSINLARVEEILEGTDYETTREVVCKVDTTEYNERVKIRNRAAELKAKMQERARKLQDIALYQMLAKEDSEMQALLNEYRSLPEM